MVWIEPETSAPEQFFLIPHCRFPPFSREATCCPQFNALLTADLALVASKTHPNTSSGSLKGMPTFAANCLHAHLISVIWLFKIRLSLEILFQGQCIAECNVFLFFLRFSSRETASRGFFCMLKTLFIHRPEAMTVNPLLLTPGSLSRAQHKQAITL